MVGLATEHEAKLTAVAVETHLPANVAGEVTELAHQVFTHGFVDAMRPTLAVPIITVAAGTLLCLLVQRRVRSDTRVAAAGPEPAGTAAA